MSDYHSLRDIPRPADPREEEIERLERDLQQYRDFRNSPDPARRSLYAQWLDELFNLKPSSAKEILRHLKAMEYKRGDEVWQDRLVKPWKEG